jgi:hypothetical protein
VAFREKGGDLMGFLDEKYKTSTSLMVYKVTTLPIAIDDIDADGTLPPQIAAPRGRPKNV